MPSTRERVIALHEQYLKQEMTLQEIGDRVGVSRERVRQIYRSAGLKTFTPKERGAIIRRRNHGIAG